MTSPDVTNLSLENSRAFDSLLTRLGIAREYTDYAGVCHQVELTTLLAVLKQLGFEVDCHRSAEEKLQQLEQQQYGRLLPPALVLESTLPQVIKLNMQDHQLMQQISWQLVHESGVTDFDVIQGQDLPEIDRLHLQGNTVSVRQLTLPILFEGYHELRLEIANERLVCQLIVVPDSSYQPEWSAVGHRVGGLSIQLYSLNSPRNWGVGDFTDLHRLVELTSNCGLGFIVLNPLHLLDMQHPQRCSPYSPSDRRFINPLYIDVEITDDFQESESTRRYVNKPAFQARLQEARDAPLIDYQAANQLKYLVLDKIYKHFHKHHLLTNSSRAKAFSRWKASRGEQLIAFGKLQAARCQLTRPVRRQAEYHLYLQWLADQQLEHCQQHARSQGMPIGLIRDLAVGSDVAGLEVQSRPEQFCQSARIGAPPDPLAPQGQNWGLPPLNPLGLQESGYSHFIELCQANMAHCGALRIDHVMGLMRLWWCENDRADGRGTYVNYPAQALFGILRLESWRQQCLLVGEDLGIVPPQVREIMSNSGILSNSLFYFEKYDARHFKRPHDFPRNTLTMITNHDVPTLAAWWNKSDLNLRKEIGLLTQQSELSTLVQARESDQIQILHWLNEQALLPANWQDFDIHHKFDTALCQAIMVAVGSSASLLVSIQLEDLQLLEQPVNIPGTFNEYPNWQRKLPGDPETIFTQNPNSDMLAAFVASREQS